MQGRLLSRIRAGGGCVRVEGTVSRKKRGGETEILKKGGKLVQRRDTLKMGGEGEAGTLLQTMERSHVLKHT